MRRTAVIRDNRGQIKGVKKRWRNSGDSRPKLCGVSPRFPPFLPALPPSMTAPPVRRTLEVADDKQNLPCDRARGRRGHAHALGAAEGAARVAGRSLLAHVLAAVREAGGTTTAVVVGPGRRARSRRKRGASLPDARDLRAGRAARHRACGAGRARRDRARRRRRARDLRRHAADPAADAGRMRGRAGRRRGGRGARLPPARPDRLWAAGDRAAASSSPSARSATRARPSARSALQRRPDGARRRARARRSSSGSATTTRKREFYLTDAVAIADEHGR